jgi:hypothetical protein
MCCASYQTILFVWTYYCVYEPHCFPFPRLSFVLTEIMFTDGNYLPYHGCVLYNKWCVLAATCGARRTEQVACDLGHHVHDWATRCLIVEATVRVVVGQQRITRVVEDHDLEKSLCFVALLQMPISSLTTVSTSVGTASFLRWFTISTWLEVLMTSTISTRPNRFDGIEILCTLGTVHCPISVVLVVATIAVVVPWLTLIYGIARSHVVYVSNSCSTNPC